MDILKRLPLALLFLRLGVFVVLLVWTLDKLLIPKHGKYLDLSSLVYFASWPVLAACFALYYLRDADTLWVVDKRKTQA